MNKHADVDRLPFAEYAELMAAQGAKERGLPATRKLSFEQLTASAMTFEEIAAQYGEETAINVGIARDPDAPELDDEWVRHARPAIEVAPDLVERYLRTRDKRKVKAKL